MFTHDICNGIKKENLEKEHNISAFRDAGER